jgi:ankyrin repeat protein
MAVMFRQAAVVQAIVDTQALDLNMQWKDGETALTYAVARPHDRFVVKVLLDGQVDVNLANKVCDTSI